MDQAAKLFFLRWCNQYGYLEGLEYRHRGYGKGRLRLSAEGEIRTDATIDFHPFGGHKVTLSLDSIVERLDNGFSKKDLATLFAKFKSHTNSKPNAQIQSSIPEVKSHDVPTELYRKIERHGSLLLETEKEDLQHFLREVGVGFLGLDWASSLLYQIRQQHPQGITTRPAKRARLFSEIEKSITDETVEWWSKIDSHQAVTILAHIDKSPEQNVDKAIEKMVSLPYSCHKHFSDLLWEFYDKHFHRLIDYLSNSPSKSFGPSVVAYAGRLVCNPKSKKRSVCLLDTIEQDGLHDFTPLIEFFRFLASEPPSISGTKQFAELDEVDLFLAACYYPEDGVAADGLSKISEWSLGTIREQLEDKAYNHFLVRGLQPRIAELAFAQIGVEIYGESGREMVDLNRQAVTLRASLGTPTKDLPKADWQDSSGAHFDVKSNLYFRSISAHLGLRGFAIKRPESDSVIYCGIVVFETSAVHCDWAYVGDFSKQCYQQLCGSATERDGRVMPFVFQMPEHYRFVVNVTPEDLQRYAALLANEQLIRAWKIAAHQPSGRQPSNATSGSQGKDWFWERFAALPPQYPIEFRLWRVLTEATLDGCTCGCIDDVGAMLEDAVSMLRTGLFPVRLAQITGKTLLERWIHSVLKPLAEHFDKITCPVCKGRNISLKLNRITPGGAIFGVMECERSCLNDSGEITILTPCHECSGYPLLIGKNKICPKCSGLVCEAEKEGRICGACKKNCHHQT